MGMDFTGGVWKRMWKMTFFGTKYGQELENMAHCPTKNSQVYPLRTDFVLRNARVRFIFAVFFTQLDILKGRLVVLLPKVKFSMKLGT